jgi:hypothetical protein
MNNMKKITITVELPAGLEITDLGQLQRSIEYLISQSARPTVPAKIEVTSE